ncbi:MAG: response regulator [Treponema sp.]|jgi:putative two-component system response regulator|nr:response regulator [Treponema sp.]
MKQILVVDDNLAILKHIQIQLAGKYQVLLAKSGAQALQICSKRVPDLILLDIDMPEMNGFETIARLKQNPRLFHIPVIFLTANRDSDTEIKGLESGAVDFITKPFEKSILIHRIRLHSQLSAYQQDLEKTVKELEDSIVLSFSELIEARDENTGGHVQRTSRYAELLIRELLRQGQFLDLLNEDEIAMSIKAVPLHDIGKIGISDSILLKPGRLDEGEFAVMKTHTTIGARILQQMFERTPTQHYLRYARIVAEGHHEKWDGSGYPRGLKGDDIPLISRIMAVADVYDALVADRVYRKALSSGEAHDHIVAGRGAHFDPKVIDAFEEIYDEMAAEAMMKHTSTTA